MSHEEKKKSTPEAKKLTNEYDELPELTTEQLLFPKLITESPPEPTLNKLIDPPIPFPRQVDWIEEVYLKEIKRRIDYTFTSRIHDECFKKHVSDFKSVSLLGTLSLTERRNFSRCITNSSKARYYVKRTIEDYGPYRTREWDAIPKRFI